MRQGWRDLLFLHWKVEPALVQEGLPEGLFVDVHEGETFVGLVPFFMRGVRPRGFPPVPGISDFLELNVRVYVHDRHGRPGVWFHSLDANQPLAVAIARRFFHLPYVHAQMSASRVDNRIEYRSRQREGAAAETAVTYSPGDELPLPEPGSLEFFLVERYLLFSWNARRKTLFSGQVHHPPYRIRNVDWSGLQPGAVEAAGYEVGSAPPVHAIYSPGVEVEVFALEEVV